MYLSTSQLVSAWNLSVTVSAMNRANAQGMVYARYPRARVPARRVMPVNSATSVSVDFTEMTAGISLGRASFVIAMAGVRQVPPLCVNACSTGQVRPAVTVPKTFLENFATGSAMIWLLAEATERAVLTANVSVFKQLLKSLSALQHMDQICVWPFCSHKLVNTTFMCRSTVSRRAQHCHGQVGAARMSLLSRRDPQAPRVRACLGAWTLSLANSEDSFCTRPIDTEIPGRQVVTL